jgi:hypothetical protein
LLSCHTNFIGDKRLAEFASKLLHIELNLVASTVGKTVGIESLDKHLAVRDNALFNLVIVHSAFLCGAETNEHVSSELAFIFTEIYLLQQPFEADLRLIFGGINRFASVFDLFLKVANLVEDRSHALYDLLSLIGSLLIRGVLLPQHESVLFGGSDRFEGFSQISLEGGDRVDF